MIGGRGNFRGPRPRRGAVFHPANFNKRPRYDEPNCHDGALMPTPDPKFPDDFENGMSSQSENHVLLFTIINPNYPITVDVMHTICSPCGKVLRIVVFRKNGVQAMVEFDSLESSRRAKQSLHGADIYSGCCTLKIEYAKPKRLNVTRNDADSYDYTIGEEVEYFEKKPLLRTPGNMPGPRGPPPPPPQPVMVNHAPMRPPNVRHYNPEMQYMYEEPVAPGQGVLLINNLNSSKVNCDHIFNLLCIYGNVHRIKFLKSREGCCMVQMDHLDNFCMFLKHLNNIYIFGKKISISFSKQEVLEPLMHPFELPDGSPSYKDYYDSRNNRYLNPRAAAKNRPVAPSNTLYYFNTPPDATEDDISKIFETVGAKKPVKLKNFPSKKFRDMNNRTDRPKGVTGLAEWNNIADASDALVLANNFEVTHPSSDWPFIFKLTYSSAPVLDECPEKCDNDPKPHSANN